MGIWVKEKLLRFGYNMTNIWSKHVYNHTVEQKSPDNILLILLYM